MLRISSNTRLKNTNLLFTLIENDLTCSESCKLKMLPLFFVGSKVIEAFLCNVRQSYCQRVSLMGVRKLRIIRNRLTITGDFISIQWKVIAQDAEQRFFQL